MMAIYTTELTSTNAHLMPWRTILEVAKCWQTRGFRVLIISGGCEGGDVWIDGIRVLQARRPKDSEAAAKLCARLVQEGVERLFFPIAPGSLYARLSKVAQSCGIGLIWYYPGSWYTCLQIARAARVMSTRALLPYVFQAVFPKRFWLRRLKTMGDCPVIAMTSHTAKQLRAYGYPFDRVFAIPPGRAPVARSGEPSAECTEIGNRLAGSRYFLFFGPPNPIRGVDHLLDAFEGVSRTRDDCRLVCLFRDDGNVDSKAARERIAQMGFGDRLLAVWHSVGPSDLDLLLRQCFAVLKPFVIVPSEIPLAVIETAEYGKPVIGFRGDGTGEFIGRFGLLAKHGDSGDLAEAMRRLLDDSTLYEERCRAALSVYKTHPSWEQVAEQWLNVGAEKVVGDVQQPCPKGMA